MLQQLLALKKEWEAQEAQATINTGSLRDQIIAETPSTVYTPVQEAPKQEVKKSRYQINLDSQRMQMKLVRNKICGGATGGVVVYDMSIATSSLDNDGFVVDNAIVKRIEKVWSSRFRVASCEQIAGNLIRFMIQSLEGRATAITATVYNQTGNVQVSWELGDEFPDHARLATEKEIKEHEAWVKANPEKPRSC